MPNRNGTLSCSGSCQVNAPVKREYLGGVIYAMAGARRDLLVCAKLFQMSPLSHDEAKELRRVALVA